MYQGRRKQRGFTGDMYRRTNKQGLYVCKINKKYKPSYNKITYCVTDVDSSFIKYARIKKIGVL